MRISCSRRSTRLQRAQEAHFERVAREAEAAVHLVALVADGGSGGLREEQWEQLVRDGLESARVAHEETRRGDAHAHELASLERQRVHEQHRPARTQ